MAGPLRARGWDTHVALVSGGPNLRRLESGGAVIHRLRPWGNHDPRLALMLARVMRRVEPDVVQVWFVQMDLAAGLAATWLRLPWVLSERSSRLAYPRTLKNQARVLMARRADAIIANSTAGAEYWRARASAVPRFVIGNGVPLEEIARVQPGMPAGLAVDDRTAVVLSAGRFSTEKNVGVLTEALAVILARPDTVAVLCGDGPLRSDVRARADAAGIGDRVHMPGYVADLWPVVRRADVVVAVGLFEGCPNTVLEAMAAERPLVVSDIPAHREILDDQSAVWVDPRLVESIAAGVLTVLADPAAAAARARKAKARVSAWSIDAIAGAHDRAYRQVVDRRVPTAASTASRAL
jgi:glycosyltransferase involved in cell wall biosynthesis